MRKKLLALLCAAVLCLCLIPGSHAATGVIYFTAVNDRLLPLSGDSMPMTYNGTLYVPYTMFDANTTGINLGVSCSYSSSGNTLTIYNLRKMLVYDLDEGNSRDQHSGEIFSSQAITRNGLVYVPLGFTCDFFGLNRSNTITQYGNLIRVTNSSAVLNDAEFIDAGSSWMASRLREYLQSISEPVPSTDPEPSQSVSPDPDPEPDPGAADRVYLAFRCQTGEAAGEILDTLDQYGYHAVFFLSPDFLAEHSDLVRRMMGSGHSVGLALDGQDADTVLAQLEEGRQLLADTVHAYTYMVCADPAVTEALEQTGCLCWQTRVSAIPEEDTGAATLAANTLYAISRRSGSIRVTMDDSSVSAQALPSILRQLRADSYEILQAVETDF